MKRRRTTKQPYHHGDLRRVVVAAAATLVADAGIDACTIRACARRAGVSHAAPLHHFADRAALLAAVAAAAGEALGAALDRAAQDAGSAPPDRLLAVGVRYVTWAAANPRLFRLLFASDAWAGHGQVVQAACAGCMAVLAREMTACLTTPGKPPDPELLHRRMDLAWAAVHGLAHLAIDGALQPPPAKAAVATRAEAVIAALHEVFVAGDGTR